MIGTTLGASILASSATTAPISWLEWPIWGFLSAVATILGLVAIVIAVSELRQRRKRVSATYLEVGSRGSGLAPDGSEFQVVSLTNAGWAQINVMRLGIVGGKIADVPGRGSKLRWHLPPGESLEFDLASSDYDSVWFLICSYSVLDRTTARWSWEPFTDSGALIATQMAQVERMGRWYYFRRFLRRTKRSQLRAVKGVGPYAGAGYVAYLPATSSHELEDANMRIAQPFAEAGGLMYSQRLTADPRTATAAHKGPAT